MTLDEQIRHDDANSDQVQSELYDHHSTITSEYIRSQSLPSFRRYDDYELSSGAISCQHQNSPSLTSSGYTKYRATPPPSRKLKMKIILFTTLFVLGSVVGLVLLIISLTSLFQEELERPEFPEAGIKEPRTKVEQEPKKYACSFIPVQKNRLTSSFWF